MKLSTVIVGLGQVGMGYDLSLGPASSNINTHAKACAFHSGFHLLSGVDPEHEKRRSFEREYGVESYIDVKSALFKSEPDVVIISTPTSLHYDTLRCVLAHSLPRAILCEKPLSDSVAEAIEMVRLCADKGVGLYVNYFRRSDPGAIEIKKRLDSGEIKAPVKGMAWYSKGLKHNGSHFINILEYWLGAARDPKIINRGRIWDGIDREPDFQVCFDRGEVLLIGAWEEKFSHHTVELLSGNGRLRYDQGGGLIQWDAVAESPIFSGNMELGLQTEFIARAMKQPQLNVIEQLYIDIADGTGNICSGKEALGTLQTVDSVISLL